ncbi:MAG: maltose alpha-D-glucosyltransferase [Dehalococcoidia bacterium]
MPKTTVRSQRFDDDALWYKDAIMYELHVRAFYDSDGDGVGDFPGLIDKLDYLEDLGVTALWLLPFYPSPLKDDGYDISDYTDIQSAYGNLSDFRTFINEAHRRGIRVITELVLNHTSDQHPWFQRARQSAPGSNWRNYYVWSETPDKYSDARIIFSDFEHSNWTMDPVTKRYYWHRFYSHQPDLNYDNPAVRRAVFKVIDFWLKMGVDGMRVDAVPYLFEREGTNCENLEETHEFVRQLRRHVDSKFASRLLLAEANQWIEDAASYFGHGDEFNMAFHFPLMPRMFMAIRMADRFPIVDILNQTPPIPEGCQWALFLRNHDELTLEMVTDEERDYMYRMYAQEREARINLGIRRRLAPLLNNDRRKIELMNALLFTLPGTPVIYYGDEIGMGDNFYLGDRNGVRTPMQWSPDRNAGFSQANPQMLYLPPIIDPEYHYEAINVENQQRNRDSLLWSMKTMISMRKRYKVLGRGTLEFLMPQNRKVLAYLRRYGDEIVLVVANLSHVSQQAHLNLQEFKGMVPVEMFGREAFNPITHDYYSFTLAPYAFYWFSLETISKGTPAEPISIQEFAEIPRVDMSPTRLMTKQNRGRLEALISSNITQRRWFGSKSRTIRVVRIEDIIPVRYNDETAQLVLAHVEYLDRESEVYILPLAIRPENEVKWITSRYQAALLARLTSKARGGAEEVLFDATFDESFCNSLLDAVARRRRFKGRKGTLSAQTTPMYRKTRGSGHLEPELGQGEQTNSSINYGNRLVLKFFRKLEEGISLDAEIGRFLTEKAGFPHTPPVSGTIEYRKKRGEPISVAVLYGYVPNEGDAWRYTMDSLDGYFDSVQAHPTVQVPPIPGKSSLASLREPPALAEETIGSYLISAQLLGKRTAQMHMALASDREDPQFSPESFSIIYQNSLYHSMRALTVQNFQMLREHQITAGGGNEDIQQVLGMEKSIIERFKRLTKKKVPAQRIRCHGDYHLGQVLYTGKDFVIIDFEGEPARPLSERRLKRCPLRDVAGMIRSFHYAVHTSLNRKSSSAVPPQDLPALEQWGNYWYFWVSASFLRAYLNEISEQHLVPDDPKQLQDLLYAYLLEKAVYEVGYELNNRPDWLKVPVRGILSLMEAGY